MTAKVASGWHSAPRQHTWELIYALHTATINLDYNIVPTDLVRSYQYSAYLKKIKDRKIEVSAFQVAMLPCNLGGKYCSRPHSSVECHFFAGERIIELRR